MSLSDGEQAVPDIADLLVEQFSFSACSKGQFLYFEKIQSLFVILNYVALNGSFDYDENCV